MCSLKEVGSSGYFPVIKRKGWFLWSVKPQAHSYRTLNALVYAHHLLTKHLLGERKFLCIFLHVKSIIIRILKNGLADSFKNNYFPWYRTFYLKCLKGFQEKHVFVFKVFGIGFIISLALYFENNLYDFGIKTITPGKLAKACIQQYFFKKEHRGYSNLPLK